MPMTEAQMFNKINYQKKQTAYAWAKYYQAETQQLVQNIVVYKKMDELPPETPDFVLEQLRELMIELKKKIECPICMDIIDPENLGISKCGHKYCKGCLDKQIETTNKCAMCRKTLKYKKK